MGRLSGAQLPLRPWTLLLRGLGQSRESRPQPSTADADCQRGGGAGRPGRCGLGAASTSHPQTEGLFRGQTEAPFTPAWPPPPQRSVCRVSCAAGTLPGGSRGRASLSTEGAEDGSCLCLLPCPGPLGPSPARPERALLVTGILCWHQGWRRGQLQRGQPQTSSGMGTAVPVPSLAPPCRVEPAPRRAKKGPIQGWRGAVAGQAALGSVCSAEQTPPCPGAGAGPSAACTRPGMGTERRRRRPLRD